MAASELLIISAALAIVGGQAQSLTAKQLETMPVEQLGQRLLPANLASTVVQKRVRRDRMLPGNPVVAVEFETQPVPAGPDLCVRQRHYVSVWENREGRVELRYPVEQVSSFPLLALSPQCALAGRVFFAQVQPATELDGSKKALRWLSWARERARNSDGLPFDVKCRSEISPNPCAKGARRSLARLPLETTFIIGPDRDAGPPIWELAITETKPGDLLWEVKLDRRGRKPIVRMTWKAPAPF